MDEQDKIAGRKASIAAAKAAMEAAKAPKSSEFRGTASAVKKSSAAPKAKAVAKVVAKVESSRMTRPGSSVKSAPKSSAPGAISGKMKSSATNKAKSSAPSAISGKKVTASSKKPAAKKSNTTSNPLTGAFNKLSPYGNKNQKFKSPIGEGLATKKSVKGKPSIGEQISGIFTGKSSASKKTYTSVAAENARRMGITVAEYNRRLNAKKK
jgi:hypothetical protein